MHVFLRGKSVCGNPCTYVISCRCSKHEGIRCIGKVGCARTYTRCLKDDAAILNIACVEGGNQLLIKERWPALLIKGEAHLCVMYLRSSCGDSWWRREVMHDEVGEPFL